MEVDQLMGTVQVLSIGDVLSGLSSKRHDASEVVRAPSGSLSVSASRRPIGSTDDQRPHAEDEVYYVIRGRAMFESDGGAVPVVAGSLVFVPAGAEHRFADITEDMQTLIFWSPARAATGSR
jgi:mannose-6-phosphate isomerase-like protein (cupin superfamily)